MKFKYYMEEQTSKGKVWIYITPTLFLLHLNTVTT